MSKFGRPHPSRSPPNSFQFPRNSSYAVVVSTPWFKKPFGGWVAVAPRNNMSLFTRSSNVNLAQRARAEQENMVMVFSKDERNKRQICVILGKEQQQSCTLAQVDD